MSRVERNKAAVERLFKAGAAGNHRVALDIFHDDLVLQINGRTPISGRWQGKNTEAGLVDVDKILWDKLVPGKNNLYREWKIVCADKQAVTAILCGEGLTTDGRMYEQDFGLIFIFRDDKVAMLYEFVDTVMIEHALFLNDLERPETERQNPFVLE